MLIDVRPVARLRGAAPVDVTSVLGPVLSAACEAGVDLARLRVTCDWIQYRGNFAAPVECRPVLAERPPDGADGMDGKDGTAPPPAALELAVDLRRAGEIDLAASVRQALAGPAGGTGPAGLALEPWGPGRRSCIWRFNALYWQALASWEQATGREYEQALPGGQTQARDVTAVRELIASLLAAWDELDARRALPDALYIAEFGVGNGSQARTWLDTFAEMDASHGRDYYRRLHYLMGDYSPHVLERARRAVAHHAGHVSTLVLDATSPQLTLGFLRGRTFCVYISNVYDNLPTDELASIAGRPYLVETRAYLPECDAARIARRYHADGVLPVLIERLLRLGPELLADAAPGHFPGLGSAVGFWQDVWSCIRLQERYVPLAGLDGYQPSASLSGEILRPLLEGSGDIRMHVSNGALASFAGTLPLLHPYGRLWCHDLFVTEPGQYQTGFHGPGKYDGSVVNWVNGPLLALAGHRRGFAVRIEAMPGRPEASVRTLTAQARD